MNQLFCNGHGSLEELNAFSPCFIPEGKILVLYTPPGAALADNLANFIMDAFLRGPYRHDFNTTIEQIKNHLMVVGRETKGYGGVTPPRGVESYPLEAHAGRIR